MTTPAAGALAGAVQNTADASKGSSPQTNQNSSSTTTTSKPQSRHERMMATAKRIRAENTAPVDDGGADPATRPEAEQQATDGGEEAGERPSPEDEKNKEKTKSEPDTVPLAAFKERVGRLTKQRDDLRTQVQAKDLELKKALAAAHLLQDTLNKVRQQHAEGTKYDERDDQLLINDVTERGRKETEKLQAEHAEALKKQNAEALAEQQREQHRTSYARDIAAALEANDLVGRAELIAALREEAGKSRPASAQQLAAVLQEEREAKARQRFGAAERQSPSTARGKPGAPQPRKFANNAKGMLEWTRANRAQ
jgi:hypothetical protein